LPRIRQLRPAFFASEQVAMLSLPARLLFVGMIDFADDEGRLKGSGAFLKASIFPFDSVIPGTTIAITFEMVQGWRDEAVDAVDADGIPLAHIYKIGATPYLWLPKFRSLQFINKPYASQLPPPPLEGMNDALATLRSSDSLRSTSMSLCKPTDAAQPFLGRIKQKLNSSTSATPLQHQDGSGAGMRNDVDVVVDVDVDVKAAKEAAVQQPSPAIADLDALPANLRLFLSGENALTAKAVMSHRARVIEKYGDLGEKAARQGLAKASLRLTEGYRPKNVVGWIVDLLEKEISILRGRSR